MREFIVEADGGSRGNPGPAGYGSVVLDGATGEPLVEAAEYIGVATNNVAEYRGLIAGLKAAYALDPTATVRVRMDSKLVVEQMSGRWKIKHPDMKPLAAEALRVFAPGQVTYEWIPRDRNKHADRLANEAMDAGKRGEQWSPAASTADLDTRATRRGTGAAASAAVPEPSGPPGDATAGAARARAALAGARGETGYGREAGGAGAPAAAAAPTSADAPASANAAAAAAAAASASVAKRIASSADVRAAKNVASVAPDLGTPATFVLLRHGETPLTPQKRFSGSGGSDPSLSDVGRHQAERVAAALALRGTIQEVVSSPLARCRETAQIVAARLGLGVTVEEGLRETDFGAWEGLTFGEVRERYPDDMNAWLASPDAEPTGGGESFGAVARRVAATRDRLTEAHRGRTVLLVSHVTPIKTLVRLALGAPPESLFRMELSAASLTALAYYADGNATLRLLNDTSHLR
ncbi:bifunctional RNase H/acid phosphatase [Streptomyces sp. HM190]|uniref:bifunctional RNase H/acid phosphatase n=1 Tax=Streptomyces sp. HM190 TaxID=2695266 RepID=UPI001359FD7F|nr:bifunctional RNase H/acid phosphatase [Streptomyces sp. HM190]